MFLSLATILATWTLPYLGRAEMTRQGEAVLPPVFSHLTPADGLPYPVALGVAQDRHGFIWAATPGGAARWDGYRMTMFRHDSNDPKPLPENIVTSALADERGIWVAGRQGLARLDVATTHLKQGYVQDVDGLGTAMHIAPRSTGRPRIGTVHDLSLQLGGNWLFWHAPRDLSVQATDRARSTFPHSPAVSGRARRPPPGGHAMK